MREFRHLMMPIMFVIAVVMVLQIFALRGRLVTELEAEMTQIHLKIEHADPQWLINTPEKAVHTLQLSELNVYKSDELIAHHQGNTQHWLIGLLSAHLNQPSVHRMPGLRITFTPNYQGIGAAQQSLLTNLMLPILGALVIILLLVARSLKSIQHRIILNLNDSKSTKPAFGRVTDLIHQQKQEFYLKLNEQKAEIESLTHRSRIDALTGLQNSEQFHQKIKALLKTEQIDAMLVYVRGSQLQHLNNLSGQVKGDNYLKSIAAILVDASQSLMSASVYRISGAEFAIICNRFNPNNHAQLASALQDKIEQYRAKTQLDNIAYLGLTPILAGETFESLMGRAELALAKAQTHSPNGWSYQQHNDSQENRVIEQWQSTITDVLNHSSIELCHQPVQSLHRNMRTYQELLTRFITSDGKMLPTDEVLAMALRLELLEPLERLMIEKMLKVIGSDLEKNQYWGINLSALAVQSLGFVRWLEHEISQHPELKNKLVFELEEIIADTHLQAAKRLSDMLRHQNCRLALSRYGRGVASFRLFKELRPDYIKIDANLISGIDSDATQQQFVRMIIEIAHRVGCQVIAEGVETLSQKQSLESMYVDGLQGYLVSMPIPCPK
jgi:diguanylate cyclase (GGDEF)-like protein